MENVKQKLYFILEELEVISKIVKKGRPRIKIRNIRDQVLKKYKIKDYSREKILKKARRKAHTSVANAYRKMSNSIRNDKIV